MRTKRRLSELVELIDSRQATVAVVGLGYVGLPVALAFAEQGFAVVGVDSDRKKTDAIRSGRSYLEDIPDDRIQSPAVKSRLRVTRSFRGLAMADAILIALPTPLKEGAPDLSLVRSGALSIAGVIQPGTLVVLESTTYPGTTEELLRPILESKGVQGGQLFLAYSPERIDPGNPLYEFQDIPKVVGGVDEESTIAASTLYRTVVPKVITVSGTREAELSKLIENTFRHVNIALVNELAIYAHELGIDIWEAIEAAATKPFGFLPFWPGPGWGGHCIPLDPAYLSWRVRQDRAHEVRFVELAHAINSEMPRYVIERASLLLNEHGKAVRGAKVLCIGVAYKGGTGDIRESPAVKVLTSLVKLGADTEFHDPLVPYIKLGDRILTSVELSKELIEEQDLVVILIPQQGIDWNVLPRYAGAILDCCNALKTKSDVVARL